MHKIKNAMYACSFAMAALVSLPVLAQTSSHAMTPDEINARHDADMKQCEPLKGNERDVCKKEADARRDTAKAQAKADKKTAEARHDAAEDSRDANYDVAKEKCDALSGDAKDTCIAKAKTKYNK